MKKRNRPAEQGICEGCRLAEFHYEDDKNGECHRFPSKRNITRQDWCAEHRPIPAPVAPVQAAPEPVVEQLPVIPRAWWIRLWDWLNQPINLTGLQTPARKPKELQE